mgnify:CR=1 FL=1
MLNADRCETVQKHIGLSPFLLCLRFGVCWYQVLGLVFSLLGFQGFGYGIHSEHHILHIQKQVLVTTMAIYRGKGNGVESVNPHRIMGNLCTASIFQLPSVLIRIMTYLLALCKSVKA